MRSNSSFFSRMNAGDCSRSILRPMRPRNPCFHVILLRCFGLKYFSINASAEVVVRSGSDEEEAEGTFFFLTFFTARINIFPSPASNRACSLVRSSYTSSIFPASLLSQTLTGAAECVIDPASSRSVEPDMRSFGTLTSITVRARASFWCVDEVSHCWRVTRKCWYSWKMT